MANKHNEKMHKPRAQLAYLSALVNFSHDLAVYNAGIYRADDSTAAVYEKRKIQHVWGGMRDTIFVGEVWGNGRK